MKTPTEPNSGEASLENIPDAELRELLIKTMRIVHERRMDELNREFEERLGTDLRGIQISHTGWIGGGGGEYKLTDEERRIYKEAGDREII